MDQKISRAIGRLIGSTLIVYACSVYVPRALQAPTRWNIFWAFFWVDGFITTAVDGGIRSARD